MRIRSAAPAKSADRDAADEVADRDADRAALLAERVLALDAAARLRQRALDRVADGDLVPACAPLDRVEHRHRRLGRIDERHRSVTSPAGELVGEPLFVDVHLRAHDRLVEVDLVRVEERAVDAGELRLAADGDAAAAAHARAVDHDRIERDERVQPVRSRRLRDRAHHRHRADRDSSRV